MAEISREVIQHEDPLSQDYINVFRSGVAGVLGGISGIITGQPLDTIRVRYQTQQWISLWDCFSTTWRQEGVLGFFRGLLPPVLGASLVNALIFSFWSRLNQIQADNRSPGIQTEYDNTLSEILMSGIGAGFLQCLIICPTDLIKIRQQGERDSRTNVLKQTQLVVTEAGFRGLFRGLVPTIIRDTPGFGAYFLTYEYLKRRLTSGPKDTPSAGTLLFSGSVAGCTGWFVTYPFDIVKSRMQMDSIRSPKYSGMMDCFQKTYREGGSKIFFRGLAPTFARAIAVNGPTFFVYELALKGFRQYDEKR